MRLVNLLPKTEEQTQTSALWIAGAGRNRRSKAAAEIEQFLNENGYKITTAGDISPMPEPKTKKSRGTKKKPTGDAVETADTAETIDGGDDLDNAADANMGDDGDTFEPIDDEPLDDVPPPEETPKGKKGGKGKGKKKEEPKAKGTETSGDPWWKATISEPLDRQDRIWVQANDPGPNAPQDVKAKFLSDLDARVTAKENAAKIDADKADKEKVKERDAERQEGKEKKDRNRRRLGIAGLAGAELTRELIANARRDTDEENTFTKPDMSEPIMSVLNFATGGGLPDALSSPRPTSTATKGRARC